MIRSDAIQITPEILGMITEIDEFKGAWRALGMLAPDRLPALRRVATLEIIGPSTGGEYQLPPCSPRTLGMSCLHGGFVGRLTTPADGIHQKLT